VRAWIVYQGAPVKTWFRDAPAKTLAQRIHHASYNESEDYDHRFGTCLPQPLEQQGPLPQGSLVLTEKFGGRPCRPLGALTKR
jgi:hypothetical protein